MSAPLPTASRWNTYSRSKYPKLWEGCILAWCPSLGQTGSRLFDYSRNNNWGTLNGMSLVGDWVPNQGGMSLSFNGSSGYVISDANMKALGTVGTISAWVNFRTLAGGTHAVIGVWYPPGIDYTIISQNGTSLYWYWRTTGAAMITSSLATAKWYHVAITNDSTTFRGYVDGVEVGNSGSFGSMTASQFAIGGWPIIWLLDGYIDDTRVYDRCLHSTEIRLLSTRRAIAYEPAYYPAYYSETDAGGGGVAKPVLFHSYYMNQGMRP